MGRGGRDINTNTGLWLFCMRLPVQLHPMIELNVNSPPTEVNGNLVFVILRLCTRGGKNDKGNVPPKVVCHFLELFAATAQQFHGYIFQASTADFSQVRP